VELKADLAEKDLVDDPHVVFEIKPVSAPMKRLSLLKWKCSGLICFRECGANIRPPQI
jgi:hypothetical protein